jgi:hypothetical protein
VSRYVASPTGGLSSIRNQRFDVGLQTPLESHPHAWPARAPYKLWSVTVTSPGMGLFETLQAVLSRPPSGPCRTASQATCRVASLCKGKSEPLGSGGACSWVWIARPRSRPCPHLHRLRRERAKIKDFLCGPPLTTVTAAVRVRSPSAANLPSPPFRPANAVASARCCILQSTGPNPLGPHSVVLLTTDAHPLPLQDQIGLSKRPDG